MVFSVIGVLTFNIWMGHPYYITMAHYGNQSSKGFSPNEPIGCRRPPSFIFMDSCFERSVSLNVDGELC